MGRKHVLILLIIMVVLVMFGTTLYIYRDNIFDAHYPEETVLSERPSYETIGYIPDGYWAEHEINGIKYRFMDEVAISGDEYAVAFQNGSESYAYGYVSTNSNAESKYYDVLCSAYNINDLKVKNSKVYSGYIEDAQASCRMETLSGTNRGKLYTIAYFIESDTAEIICFTASEQKTHIEMMYLTLQEMIGCVFTEKDAKNNKRDSSTPEELFIDTIHRNVYRILENMKKCRVSFTYENIWVEPDAIWCENLSTGEIQYPAEDEPAQIGDYVFIFMDIHAGDEIAVYLDTKEKIGRVRFEAHEYDDYMYEAFPYEFGNGHSHMHQTDEDEEE